MLREGMNIWRFMSELWEIISCNYFSQSLWQRCGMSGWRQTLGFLTEASVFSPNRSKVRSETEKLAHLSVPLSWVTWYCWGLRRFFSSSWEKLTGHDFLVLRAPEEHSGGKLHTFWHIQVGLLFHLSLITSFTHAATLLIWPTWTGHKDTWCPAGWGRGLRLMADVSN